MVALVQTTEYNHIVGLAGFGHRIGNELLGSACLAQVLAGGHSVVLSAGVAHIAALIVYMAVYGAQTVEGRYLPLHLER